MKAQFKIGDEVFYKKRVNVTGPDEYIVRKGTIITLRVSSVSTFPHYEVCSFGDVSIKFILPEFDLYECQKDVLRSIR